MTLTQRDPLLRSSHVTFQTMIGSEILSFPDPFCCLECLYNPAFTLPPALEPRSHTFLIGVFQPKSRLAAAQFLGEDVERENLTFCPAGSG